MGRKSPQQKSLIELKDPNPSLRAIAEGSFDVSRMIAIRGVNIEDYEYIMKKSSCGIPENEVKAFIGKKTDLFSQAEVFQYEPIGTHLGQMQNRLP